MQAYAAPHNVYRPVTRRTPRQIRRTRTLRVAGLLLVLVAVLVFAPRVVQTSSRTEVLPAVIHTVAEGESLWEVASQHSKGRDIRKVVAEIKRVNGLATSTVQPGQQLRVPVHQVR